MLADQKQDRGLGRGGCAEKWHATDHFLQLPHFIDEESDAQTHTANKLEEASHKPGCLDTPSKSLSTAPICHSHTGVQSCPVSSGKPFDCFSVLQIAGFGCQGVEEPECLCSNVIVC